MVVGRSLDRYLLREVLPAFFVVLSLFASLLVIATAVPRLGWIPGASWLAVVFWLWLLTPQALLQITPMALLLASLLSIGRLQQGREWLALQAGGVAPRRLAALFVGFAGALGLLVLLLNQWGVPAANAAAASAFERMATSQSGLFRLAAQRVPVAGFTLQAQRVLSDGTLVGVRLERWDGAVYTLLRAERGELQGRDLVLYEHRIQRFDFDALRADVVDVELRLQELLRVDARGAGEASALVISTGVDEVALVASLSAAGFEDSRSLTRLLADAGNAAGRARERREAALLLHRRLAEALASPVLLLVGLPLGLRFGRTRTLAVGCALLLLLLWFVLFAAGQTLALGGAMPLWLGAWLANLVCVGAAGGWLLWRGLRG